MTIAENDDKSGQEIEHAKMANNFDQLMAEIIATELKQSAPIDIEKLVKGVKKRVNPKMISTGNNWDNQKKGEQGDNL